MKSRLLLSLLICAALLSACYRQAEEPFQQIDSAEVVAESTVAVVVVGADEAGAAEDAGGFGTAGTPGQYITPETVPGQVEQPTMDLTAADAIPLTSPAATREPFVLPTATRTFEEELDADDECVYTVQAGNVLFRLALAWGTTYQTIMEVNELSSEDLSIGQLLLIPDCESSAPDDAVAEAQVTPGAVELTEEELAEQTPTEQPEPTATPRPQIHVVSAGETVASISLRYRVDVNELIALNEITDRNRLRVGQELQLPPG